MNELFTSEEMELIKEACEYYLVTVKRQMNFEKAYIMTDLVNKINDIVSSSSSDFDSEISETLKLAGVQLNEEVVNGRNAVKVKDLIEILQKCNPSSIIIVSEKPGRGGASCYVYTGYTNRNGFFCSKTQSEEYNIPAVEITCDF